MSTNKQTKMEPVETSAEAFATLVCSVIIFIFCWKFKKFADSIASDRIDNKLQNRIWKLPVLTNDAEITAAIQGEPHEYLIKNYSINNQYICPVRDTVFNVLNGNYICIYITEEHPEGMGRAIHWSETPFNQQIAQLCFNDGTPIALPNNLRFIFSQLRKYKRVWQSEINPDKQYYFINSRYYPNKEDHSLRYNYTYMPVGEKASFAVRLGNGKADMNVYDDENIVVVGSGKIFVSTEESLRDLIWRIIIFGGIGGAILMFVNSLIKLLK